MSGPVPHAQMPWRFIPWHIEEGPAAVRSNAGWIVCATSSDADAACIVHRVNNWDTLEAERDALKARVEALVEAINNAISEIEGGQLYERMCCSGHECGCQGSDNASFLVWNLRESIARAALAKGEQP